MRITYYASGWPINIGNAFIDYGSVHALKTAMPTATVFYASELPKWLFWVNHKDPGKSLDLAELMDTDYLVVSGMSLCDEFIAVEGPVLQRMSERGVKIVFNGGGGQTYEPAEVEHFRAFFQTINCVGFLSRDARSYENFQDCCPLSYSGIDCGFFLSDAFTPAPLVIRDYVVYAFDQKQEPPIAPPPQRIIRAHHASSEVLPNLHSRWLRAGRTALALQRTWPFVRLILDGVASAILDRQDTLISDLADDYLHLYANASAVYSDRVHACVAALSFGKSARLYADTPRGSLFDRVGAAALTDRLVSLDQDELRTEKENQVAFLRKIFEQKDPQ